ncbi:MAG: hypothetical protein AAFY49_00940 [Pseudomonadota bacterium]
MFRKALAAGCVALLVTSGAALASDTPQPVQQHNSNALWFENWTGLSNASMVINHPDGTLETIEAGRGTPVFKLTGAKVLDGIYRYELRAATDKTTPIKNPINNGRGDAARSETTVPFYLTGHFTVSRGVIVTPEDLKEE